MKARERVSGSGFVKHFQIRWQNQNALDIHRPPVSSQYLLDDWTYA